jgi:hypothetical protein
MAADVIFHRHHALSKIHPTSIMTTVMNTHIGCGFAKVPNQIKVQNVLCVIVSHLLGVLSLKFSSVGFVLNSMVGSRVWWRTLIPKPKMDVCHHPDSQNDSGMVLDQSTL